MIRVSVEVSSRVGSDFRVMVCAQTIGRALSMANHHYPDSEIRIVFPIDPDTFFAGEPVPVSGLIQEMLDETAPRASSQARYEHRKENEDASGCLDRWEGYATAAHNTDGAQVHGAYPK